MDLKEYLEENNIKYTDFAKQLNTSPRTLWNVINLGKCTDKMAKAITKLTQGQVTKKDIKPKD